MALLAGRVPGLLPLLDEDAAMEVTAVHSAAGALDPADPLVSVPPFCAPHHGSGAADLAGGWDSGVLRPGAASLGHRGVLFLDQAPEFGREALDVLRAPIETGEITPAEKRLEPAQSARCRRRFILITASAPCRCLALRTDPGPCTCCACRARQVRRTAVGPLRDRVSLRAAMMPPPGGQVGEAGEATAVIAARVAAARERAALRLAGTPWRANAEVPREELLRRFMPHGGGWEPIERAAGLGMVSEFAAADALRVAWTFADLNWHLKAPSGRLRGRPRTPDGRTAMNTTMLSGEEAIARAELTWLAEPQRLAARRARARERRRGGDGADPRRAAPARHGADRGPGVAAGDELDGTPRLRRCRRAARSSGRWAAGSGWCTRGAPSGPAGWTGSGTRRRSRCG